MCKIIKFQTKAEKQQEFKDMTEEFFHIKYLIDDLIFTIQMMEGYNENYREENGEEKYWQTLEEVEMKKEQLEALEERAECLEKIIM
jgi:hypothetical protein